MSETWRCRRCGKLIGVYVPLVKLIDGRAHKTSRAGEPQLAAQHECYTAPATRVWTAARASPASRRPRVRHRPVP